MSRIHTPATSRSCTRRHPSHLQAVEKQLGVVPNLFRVVANSPAALKGYLAMSGALGKGALPVADSRTHRAGGGGTQRLRLLPVGSQLPGQATWRSWTTPRSLPTARRIARPEGRCRRALRGRRGAPARARQDSDLQAVRSAGYSDAQILDILLHVALNTFTNYVNEVAQTEIDFPVVEPLRLAA